MDTNGLHRLGLDHAIKFGRRTQVLQAACGVSGPSLSILRCGQVLPVLLLGDAGEIIGFPKPT